MPYSGNNLNKYNSTSLSIGQIFQFVHSKFFSLMIVLVDLDIFVPAALSGFNQNKNVQIKLVNQDKNFSSNRKIYLFKIRGLVILLSIKYLSSDKNQNC